MTKEKRKTDYAEQKLLSTVKKKSRPMSTADIAAESGLSLDLVSRALPVLADEYRGRIQVSERGELVWSFPQGFTSRYRGFSARFKRFWQKTKKVSLLVLSTLFKFWILFTLVGYFVFFILLTLVATFAISAAGSKQNGRSSSRSRSSGINLHLIDFALRLWFYSELTRPRHGSRASRKARPKKSPLHKAIFDFIFGPADPNLNLEEEERRTFTSWIANRGGITSLGEFIGFSGLSPDRASERLLEYSSLYEGQASITDDGSLIYHFDRLLERTEFKTKLSWPEPEQRVFSTNKKSLNRGFAIVNGVNLLFGGYFLLQGLSFSAVSTDSAISILYHVAVALFANFSINPTLVPILLGFIPFTFSFLFWTIPYLRSRKLKRENRQIELNRFSARTLSHAWKLGSQGEAIENKNEVANRTYSELIAHGEIEQEPSEGGGILWRFPFFKREAEALKTLRTKGREAGLGSMVFDSHSESTDIDTV